MGVQLQGLFPARLARGAFPAPRKERAVSGLHDLAREYEAKRFPVSRRLDLHAEGPAVARDRALKWIQSYAHEEPGQELLLIVERGRRPGRPPSPVHLAVERLLRELQGGLIEWWQVFGPGSLAVKVAIEPRMVVPGRRPAEPAGDGRTPETAGAAPLAAHHDIPDELLDLAERVAELRRDREGISVGMLDVVLRRVWIEAQAAAMAERITFEAALERLLEREHEINLEEMETDR